MSVIANNIDYQQNADTDQNMASPSQASPLASAASGTAALGGGASSSSGQKATLAAAAASGSSSGGNDTTTQILTKPRLQELVREIDPTEQLDEEVEELLLQIADDFVENTVNSACLLAKHRKVAKVEVRDVQLHLERNWNMWIPGFGTDELRPYKRATVTEAHKQRLALIRKAIKKY
ncbi:transcription initiation factor TFIID subunit 12 isoform X1 [Wyeomyia smithii]|uniref:transcription initiation factor TFIID subunit 12 isoform X1 n=2 Tax=Wyeomyia smithii TaxID=174621 RepID=UPI002467F72F|nr:transcription initiation factor TFIID subunit 12 isoform X1 [Wyeomyia smithii]XP_055541176.1 transcription initiation factor TFIID subunit 12 isoform X1 [Wyeomyia smithii]XP_055541177.1 transcription initiation factor TFIID subunit 12 isoform X1 [Wyeomyia smithii]XP_055541178.1 transcription initiation factor TFIID subunit 12 isoform X1 [Wyeomyia smithii]XP_055541180.1 transcription initiation factor TFIID subunit 12 isoform X1 [Wyeomyia smithii]